MNHEDEVVTAIAQKLRIKTIKRIKELTCDDHPCECKRNLILTMNAIIQFGTDVFKLRPEFHASIIILADASQEMMAELKKTKSGKVIYL